METEDLGTTPQAFIYSFCARFSRSTSRRCTTAPTIAGSTAETNRHHRCCCPLVALEMSMRVASWAPQSEEAHQAQEDPATFSVHSPDVRPPTDSSLKVAAVVIRLCSAFSMPQGFHCIFVVFINYFGAERATHFTEIFEFNKLGLRLKHGQTTRSRISQRKFNFHYFL